MSIDFYKFVEENCPDILNTYVPYSHPTYINEDKLFSYMDDILSNNRKVLIVPDPDPDGLLSCLEWTVVLDNFGHTNYEVWEYRNRNHSVDCEAISYSIEGKFDYIIILDAGSNDMVNINKLSVFGVKSIIIDHHVSSYDYDDYPSENVIINTIMNNRRDANSLYRLSAGALNFTLLYKYCCSKKRYYDYLSVYGLITLYSDCIDMSSYLNRSIYYMAVNTTSSLLPRFVRDFLNNSVFNRRFVEFTLVPKINSLFRAEEFSILNKYFFDGCLTSFERNSIVNKIMELYDVKRKMVARVTDLVQRDVLNNFVIANLSSCDLPDKVEKLYNYTGLIANNLAQEYGKPCIVLCDTGTNVKGSFRDLLGRNYLEIFCQFSKSEGHPAAFGINLNYVDVADFIDMIKNTVDKKFFIYKLEDNLVLDMNDVTPNVKLLKDIAYYNEFSGQSLPMAVVKKRHMMREFSNYKKSYYNYKWGDLTVESQYKLVLGSYIKIKPVLAKNLRLISYARGA